MNQQPLCSNQDHATLEDPVRECLHQAARLLRLIRHFLRSQWQSSLNRVDAEPEDSVQERLDRSARLQRLIRHLWR